MLEDAIDPGLVLARVVTGRQEPGPVRGFHLLQGELQLRQRRQKATGGAGQIALGLGLAGAVQQLSGILPGVKQACILEGHDLGTPQKGVSVEARHHVADPGRGAVKRLVVEAVLGAGQDAAQDFVEGHAHEQVFAVDQVDGGRRALGRRFEVFEVGPELLVGDLGHME